MLRHHPTGRIGRLLLWAAAATALAGAGCDGRGHEVQSYSVPKETPPLPAPNALAQQPLPAGDMAWTLPAGWARVENTNSMRFATLMAGTGDDQTEVAITRLIGTAGGVTSNVNRWREQVGLAPATAEEMPGLMERITRGSADGLMVDLVGPGDDADDDDAPRMLAAIFPTANNTWFVKIVGTRASLDGHRDGFVEFCNSVRFAGSVARQPAPGAPTATPPAGGRGEPTWERVPEGWTLDTEPKAMSVASLTVSMQGQTASLTITPLGGSQDLLANINRWRGQLGLSPVASLDEAQAVPIEVGGDPGHLVNVAGSGQRTLAAVAERNGTTWFYKLSGPDAVVASQLGTFSDFVRSIRYMGSGVDDA
ncbi:MAG: hypothetical protein ACYTGP_02805 [Planctomycetota bacterium]